jgi:hypothetical protein
MWAALIVTSLMGMDVRIPPLGRLLQRASIGDPRARG